MFNFVYKSYISSFFSQGKVKLRAEPTYQEINTDLLFFNSYKRFLTFKQRPLKV